MIVQENLCSTPKRNVPLARDNPRTAMLLSCGRPWSRSEIMLKAALSADQKLNTKINNDIMTAGAEGRNKLLLLQQASQQKKKNKVLFSEPVVSDSFEYEPTVLLEQDNNATTESQEDTSEELKYVRKAYRRHRSASTQEFISKIQQQRTDSAKVDKCTGDDTTQDLYKTAQKRNIENKYDDNGDTDDDELFTLAPSSFDYETQPAKDMATSPRKRPYELTFHDSKDSLNGSDLGRDNGCLFSPPKVAKVAPYFREPPEAKPQTTDLKSSHTSAVRARILDLVYFLFR